MTLLRLIIDLQDKMCILVKRTASKEKSLRFKESRQEEGSENDKRRTEVTGVLERLPYITLSGFLHRAKPKPKSVSLSFSRIASLNYPSCNTRHSPLAEHYGHFRYSVHIIFFFLRFFNEHI